MLTVIKKSRQSEGFFIIMTLTQWVLMTPENSKVDLRWKFRVHPSQRQNIVIDLKWSGKKKKKKDGMEGGLKEEDFLSTAFSW